MRRRRYPAIICLLMAGLLLLAGCGGSVSQAPPAPQTSEQENDASAADDTTLRIPYDAADSLHPYEAVGSLNLAVARLRFDALTRVDEEMNWEPALARSVTGEGDSWTVTLRDGVSFSDGAPLDADDVVYSYTVAAASENYAAALAGIASVRADGDSRVVFTLRAPNILFPYLLGLPIIKAGSNLDPVGTGRFVLDTENNWLTMRSGWYGGGLQRVRTIYLVDEADQETLPYNLQIGRVDYLFSDLSVTSAGQLGTGSIRVPMTNLVYLGVNTTAAATADPQIRQLLAALFDRQSLAEQAYQNWIVAADTPFYPGTDLLAGTKTDFTPSVEELFAALSLDNTGPEGYISTVNGPLSFTLLVNQENQQRLFIAARIAETMAADGVEIIVEELPFAEYVARIAAGDYELYLGEAKLTQDFDLSPLFTAALGYRPPSEETPGDDAGAEGGEDTPGEAEAEGAQASADAAARSAGEAWAACRRGEITLEAFLETLGQERPFIPLGYRMGAVAFGNKSYYGVVATEQDIFYNIEDW